MAKWITFQRRARMPEMMIDIAVDEVAKVIKAMNEKEVETLTLLLTEEGAELLERKKDLELRKVKFLTRDEAFDV
jgi:hypothetical protein